VIDRARLSLAAAALAALLVVPGARPVDAQLPDLASRCVAAGTGDAFNCQRYALGARLAHAGLGLALTGGNAFQGSTSTLGRRFGATPRVALSVRGAMTRFPTIGSVGGGVSGEWTVSPSIHGQVTVGVFDGVQPGPTVGGLFSIDLIGTAGVAFLPDTRGFEGHMSGFGYGVRLGVIRESFTLPGITLSATRTHGGSMDFQGGDYGVAFDGVLTTSLRGVVGKELMIGGVLAGVGWDRYSSDGQLDYSGPVIGFPPPPTSLDGFDSSRLLFFGGWSKTFLIMQISAEVGWARGFDDETPLVVFDSGAASWFGSLALRLTL
jgi:hypothetical protein